MFSRDGSLLPSIYADTRYIDDVIAIEGVVDLKLYVGDAKTFRMVDFIDNVGHTTELPTADNPSPEHKLGSLKEGQAIYFAIHSNGNFGCDATFVRWRITMQ